MSKTSTKKSPNRKHTSTTSTATVQTHARHAATAASVADAKKRVSLGNTGAASKLRKKSRKKLSHQQAAEARDTLDAEFRDMRRVGTMNNTAQSPSQLPDGTAFAPPSLRTVPEAAGFGLSVPPSEQSVQDLAGILSML